MVSREIEKPFGVSVWKNSALQRDYDRQQGEMGSLQEISQEYSDMWS